MESKKINFFQTIDEKISALFIQFTQNNLSKFNDYIENNFSDKEKKIIHLLSAFAIISIPLILVFILFLSNNNLSNQNIAIKKIISNVQHLESDEDYINKKLNGLIPIRNISDPKEFSQYIYRKLRSSDVSLKDILIDSANNIETIGDVAIVQIEGKIKSLGIKELSIVLKIIQELNPIKFNEIEIIKNNKNNLLDINFNFEGRAKK